MSTHLHLQRKNAPMEQGVSDPVDSIRKVEASKYMDKVDMPAFKKSILLSMIFGLGL